MSEPATEQTVPAAAADTAALLPAPPAPAKPVQVDGPRKAAILIKELGPDQAAQIFQHLNQRQIEQLVIQVADLGVVTPEERNAVMQEFFHTHLAQNYVSEGGLDFARTTLEMAVGVERAEEILGRLSGVFEVQPFDFLKRVSPQQITSFLINEQPQVIAVVLAYMPSELGARVLEALPPHLKSDVAERLATMEATDPAYIRSIERAMETQLRDVLTQRLERKGGIETLVGILGNVDRSSERQVLDDFDVKNPALAEEVRKRMFLFEDIIKLDDRDLQKVLQGIDMNDLSLALRNAASELLMKVKANMSERQRQNLEDLMEGSPARKRTEIEEAQTRVVDKIRQLEAAGEVTILRGQEELI